MCRSPRRCSGSISRRGCAKRSLSDVHASSPGTDGCCRRMGPMALDGCLPLGGAVALVAVAVALTGYVIAPDGRRPRRVQSQATSSRRAASLPATRRRRRSDAVARRRSAGDRGLRWGEGGQPDGAGTRRRRQDVVRRAHRRRASRTAASCRKNWRSRGRKRGPAEHMSMMKSLLKLLVVTAVVMAGLASVEAQAQRQGRRQALQPPQGPGAVAPAEPPGVTPAEIQRMFDAYALVQAQEQLHQRRTVSRSSWCASRRCRTSAEVAAGAHTPRPGTGSAPERRQGDDVLLKDRLEALRMSTRDRAST